jgi:hypothetical protein
MKSLREVSPAGAYPIYFIAVAEMRLAGPQTAVNPARGLNLLLENADIILRSAVI